MRCMDCGTTKHKKLYDDPRSPPLDSRPCLCKDCAHNAIDDLIDGMDSEVRRLIAVKDNIK